jgi:[2Fe-2S] binding domain
MVPTTSCVSIRGYRSRPAARAPGSARHEEGLNHGQCGTRTVLVDGRRINSCLALAVIYDGSEITTVEGLAAGDTLHPLQAAFIEHDAFQCGYCTPGQLCSAVVMHAARGRPRCGEPRHAGCSAPGGASRGSASSAALTGRAQRIGDALRQSGIAPDISADIKGRAVGQDSFLLITGIGGVTALARSAIGPSSRARRAAFFSERHARKSSRARKPPKPHTFKQPISMPCSRGRRTRDAMAILDGTRSRRLPPSRGRRAERRCHPSRKSSTASRRRSARRSWRARRCTSHPDRRRRKHPRHRPFRPERETSMGSQMPQPPDRRRNWQREAATGPFAHDGAHVTITARRRERQSPRRGAGASHRYSRRSILSPPYSCLASGVLTRCSPTNHTCISLVRITSETSRSLVPSSPASAAWRAIARASFRTISCA